MNSLLQQLFPLGMESIVNRQISRLPESMQPLLAAAAVAGYVIDPLLLGKLIQQEKYSFSFDEWLVQCVSMALVEIDEGQVQFASAELHLAILEALVREEQLRWHEQIAAVLEAMLLEHPEHAATLADHWQELGNQQKEHQFAHLAGAFACQQRDYDTAVYYFTRALNLTAQDDLPEQYHLLLARESVYHVLGNRDAQKDDLTRLAEIADYLSAASGDEWRTEVALRLGTFAEVTGEYTVAVVAATEALRLAEAAQTPAHEAASYLLWGQALLRQGKYEETREKLQLSLIQSRVLMLPQIEADSLRFLGVCATDMGQFDEARQHYEAALPLYRHLQDKRGESTVLNNLSIVSYSQNQLVAAMTHWEEARLIHASIGDKEGTARVLANLSSVCLDLGEYEKGRAYSQEALAICREIDLRFGQGITLINLSLFNFYLQDAPKAEIFSRAALELAREMKSKPLEGLALKDRAYLLLQQQQWHEAEEIYQQAQALWQELAQPLQLLEAQAGLGKVALAQEKLVEARDRVQPLVAYLQAGNDLAGTSRPFFIYLVLFEVLSAEGDPYAVEVLQQAYDHLTLFANKIADLAQQQAFYQNVVEHQELQALYTSVNSAT